MSEEWGPWIEHDGKGCPVPIGTFVEGVFRAGRSEIWCVGEYIYKGRVERCSEIAPRYSLWHWALHGNRKHSSKHIIRYRIRRPRALQQLIDSVENLPAPQPDEVPA